MTLRTDIVAGDSGHAALHNDVNAAVNRAAFDVRSYGATGDGTTDDTAAIQAAIDAASGGGPAPRVFLPAGTYKISDEIVVSGIPKPSGDDWQDRGHVITGAGVNATRIVSTHGGNAFRFTGAKMFCWLQDMELHGPGADEADSCGILWDGTDGNARWSNLYIHDYEAGIRWHDATLHTLVNVAVRNCATGAVTGYNHDIHTWIGCRLDYNDTALQVGSTYDAYTEDASYSNPIQFIGCRISNNDTRGVFVSDKFANVSFDGCYFESNPREADIGVSARGDTVGPIVSFTDCFFTPVTTAPVAVGIEVHNPALVTVDRCSTDGSSRYTIFTRLNDNKAIHRQTGRSFIRAATADVQYGGRDYLSTLENREDIFCGGAQFNIADAGYTFPASGVWRIHSLANGTDKTWDSWRRLNSSTGATLSEITMRAPGGTLIFGGSGATPGYIAATSISALPTATANLRGALALVTGGSGVADVIYVCRKDDTDAYEWQALA